MITHKKGMRHSSVILVKSTSGNKVTWFPKTKTGIKAHRKFMRDNKKEGYTSRVIGVTPKAARRARKGR